VPLFLFKKNEFKMKNLLFLLLTISLYSVKAQFKREFVKSEIHFKTNEILQGYIFDDFAQNDWYGKGDIEKTTVISGAGPSVGIPGSVNSFQTIIKTIHYKQNENDGQQIDYDSENIDFIIVYRNGETQKYKTSKVVRGNFEDVEDVKFDTLNRNIWLPVRKEGKINMYGYYNWTISKGNGWAEVYFQRNGKEFSINPILTHKMVWGLKSQRPLIKASLLKIFNDCPEFEENIETIVDEYINDFYTARGISKEEKKQIKSQPKEKRDRVEYEIREKKSFMPYENILNKYNGYCGN